MTIEYTSKAGLQADLAAWVTARDAARVAGKTEPPVPNSIGTAILHICQRMSTRANFNGYTYLEEMVGDAVLDCTRAVRNYNVNRIEQNPFGYFSRISWNAMLRRIEVEGNQTKLKQELMFDENHIAFSIIEGDGASIDKNELRQFYNFGE